MYLFFCIMQIIVCLSLTSIVFIGAILLLLIMKEEIKKHLKTINKNKS